MTVSQDLSFISLISNASLLVQLIMLLLLVVSLMSWTFIFQKMFAIKNARAETGNFEQAFWSGGNLQSLYQRAGQQQPDRGAGKDFLCRNGRVHQGEKRHDRPFRPGYGRCARWRPTGDEGRRTSGKWTIWNPIWRFWRQSVPFLPMSVFSGRSGAS